jgi:hypothetical protein
VSQVPNPLQITRNDNKLKSNGTIIKTEQEAHPLKMLQNNRNNLITDIYAAKIAAEKLSKIQNILKKSIDGEEKVLEDHIFIRNRSQRFKPFQTFQNTIDLIEDVGIQKLSPQKKDVLDKCFDDGNNDNDSDYCNNNDNNDDNYNNYNNNNSDNNNNDDNHNNDNNNNDDGNIVNNDTDDNNNINNKNNDDNDNYDDNNGYNFNKESNDKQDCIILSPPYCLSDGMVDDKLGKEARQSCLSSDGVHLQDTAVSQGNILARVSTSYVRKHDKISIEEEIVLCRQDFVDSSPPNCVSEQIDIEREQSLSNEISTKEKCEEKCIENIDFDTSDYMNVGV